jgi:hypothetical protein
MHINQTKAAIGVIAGEQNCVGVADNTDVRSILTVRLRDGKSPP